MRSKTYNRVLGWLIVFMNVLFVSSLIKNFNYSWWLMTILVFSLILVATIISILVTKIIDSIVTREKELKDARKKTKKDKIKFDNYLADTDGSLDYYVRREIVRQKLIEEEIQEIINELNGNIEYSKIQIKQQEDQIKGYEDVLKKYNIKEDI